MLSFIVGTTAEIIKIAPVALGMDRAGVDYRIVLTGQHGGDAREAISDFGLRGEVEDVDFSFLGIRSFPSAAVWFIKTFCLLLFARRFFRISSKNTQKSFVIIVHGDTLSTLLGSLIATIRRIDLVHIEAGLRSSNLANPFPEELIRMVVSRLSTVNFAPSQNEVFNLINSRGETILTNGNTSLDSLRLVSVAAGNDFDDKSYCLVLLHRTEFLKNSKVRDQTFQEILEISEKISIRVVADGMSKPYFLKYLKFNPNVSVLEKMNYFEFHNLLAGSTFVITDSGGLQEECAALGIPCLIHRSATERDDGLLSNAKISRWAPGELIDFSIKYEQFRRNPMDLNFSPSEVILNDFRKRNWF